MDMLTGKHQTPAGCSVLLLSKKYKMAFKELEHRGHCLRLQTTAWLVPCAFPPVAFGQSVL